MFLQAKSGSENGSIPGDGVQAYDYPSPDTQDSNDTWYKIWYPKIDETYTGNLGL